MLTAPNADHKAIMGALAAYLVGHNMTQYVDVVMNDIAEELYEQSKLLTVEVTSARPLEKDAVKQLTDFMKQQTGAESISLHQTTDETLIGGMVARTPTAEIDASVRNKLRQLTALT